MAEMTISCPRPPLRFVSTGIDVQRRTLIRTGGNIPQNVAVDILDPGTGWVVLGDELTFFKASEFTELTQIYRNGIHQLAGESASDDNDVYFVAPSGSIAFEHNLVHDDVVQIWKFNPTTTGGQS